MAGKRNAVFIINFDREEIIVPKNSVDFSRNYRDLDEPPCTLIIDDVPYCPGECPQMTMIHKDDREVTIFVYGEPRLFELPESAGALYGRALHDDILEALNK